MPIRDQLIDNQIEKRPLWTVDDVAAYLQVEIATVRDWVYKKKIPFRKAGGSLRFAPSEIEGWTLQHRKE